MADPARQVLAGMISAQDITLVDELGRRLTEHHFTDPTLRSLFRLALSYRSIADGPLSEQAVKDAASQKDVGTAALLTETYDALAQQPISPADTRWAAEQLRAERERSLTRTALRDAEEILSGQVTEESGRTWSGPEDARVWASERISEINAETQTAEAPAGDVRNEARDILQTYIRAKKSDDSSRIKFGIPSLDEATGGFGPGDFVTIAAPSGTGKSQACVQLAYSAACNGHNVYFATSETVRDIVRARLVCRHSMSDRMAGHREQYDCPDGLNSKHVVRGTVQGPAEKFLGYCAQDLAQAPGSIWVAQVPHGQTVSALFSQVEMRSRAMPVDLVIIDYLKLLSPGRRLASSREGYVATIIDAAHFAVDFNKGHGVPVVTPWQFNKEAQKEMIKTGELELRGLEETSEIINSSDAVVTLMPEGQRESDNRHMNLRANLPKNRSGEALIGDQGVALRVDYATCRFVERQGAESMLGGALSEDAMSGLLDDPLGG